MDSPHAPSDLGFYLPWMGVHLRLKHGGAGLAGFVDDFSFLELAGLWGLWDVGTGGASLGRLSSCATARVVFAMARACSTKSRRLAFRFAMLQRPQHGTEFSLV